MKSPESYPAWPILSNVVLLPPATRTTNGTGVAVALEGFTSLVLQLDVTAAATEAGDTLDVFLQTTIDGTNWIDIMHFVQVLGNGGAKRLLSKLQLDTNQGAFDNTSTLLAGVGRSIFGEQYRTRWEIVDVSTANASFTFSVSANAT